MSECWHSRTEVDVSATRIRGKMNKGPRILFCLKQFRLMPESYFILNSFWW